LSFSPVSPPNATLVSQVAGFAQLCGFGERMRLRRDDACFCRLHAGFARELSLKSRISCSFFLRLSLRSWRDRVFCGSMASAMQVRQGLSMNLPVVAFVLSALVLKRHAFNGSIDPRGGRRGAGTDTRQVGRPGRSRSASVHLLEKRVRSWSFESLECVGPAFSSWLSVKRSWLHYAAAPTSAANEQLCDDKTGQVADLGRSDRPGETSNAETSLKRRMKGRG
jgi:hypothetical protein